MNGSGVKGEYNRRQMSSTTGQPFSKGQYIPDNGLSPDVHPFLFNASPIVDNSIWPITQSPRVLLSLPSPVLRLHIQWLSSYIQSFRKKKIFETFLGKYCYYQEDLFHVNTPRRYEQSHCYIILLSNCRRNFNYNLILGS